MTQSEIERAVCRATGESRGTVRSLGFSLLREESDCTDDLLLVLNCPGCGVPLDTRDTTAGPPHLVECHRCDAAYPFAIDEIYVANGCQLPAAAYA